MKPIARGGDFRHNSDSLAFSLKTLEFVQVGLPLRNAGNSARAISEIAVREFNKAILAYRPRGIAGIPQRQTNLHELQNFQGKRKRIAIMSEVAATGDSLVALAATMISYSATELAHGYGFLAVFITALVIRQAERTHEFSSRLHDFAEQIERLLMMMMLVLFGGAIATGRLWDLAYCLLGRPRLSRCCSCSWCDRSPAGCHSPAWPAR